MEPQELEFPGEGDLVLRRKTLLDAGLQGRLRVLIREREIRVLPKEGQELDELLDRLAGCLGEESASDYDFHLKTGGLYEAR